MPMVPKNAAPTWLKRALASVSGVFAKPSTDTSFPQLLPARTGTIAAVTPVTPGRARSSSSSWLNSAMRARARVAVENR